MQRKEKNQLLKNKFVCLLGGGVGLFSLVGYLPLWEKEQYLLCVFLWTLSVILLYKLASIRQHPHFSEFSRGLLIGQNLIVNLWIWEQLLDWEGVYFFIVLGLPSCLYYFSQNTFYQSLIAWSGLLLPLSLPVYGLGLLFFIINLLLSPIGYLTRWKGLQIKTEYVARYGVWVVYGGAIRAMRGYTGFNMGYFIFIHKGRKDILAHELGHTLSLATLGAVFHYIGAIDENFIQKHSWQAYAEVLAESHDQSVSHEWGNVWANKFPLTA